MSRLVAFAVVASAAVAGCSGDLVEQSGLPIEEDFSGDECPWLEEQSTEVSLRCREGAYEFEIRVRELGFQMVPQRLDAREEAVGVEAVVAVDGFPEPTGDDVEFHGVFCDSAPPDEPAVKGYLLGLTRGPISSDRAGETFPRRAEARDGLAIIRFDGERPRDRGRVDPLVDEYSDVVRPSNRIGAECRTVEGGVELSLLVDEVEVASAFDAQGFAPFEAVGLVVVSSSPGTRFVIDDFKAWEP